MPFTPEQQKAYYEANKLKLNQQRAERRKLARLGQSNNLKVETSERVETLLTNLEVETVLPKDKVETFSQVETAQSKNIGLGQVETDKKVETGLRQIKKVEVETISKIEQKERVETVEQVETTKEVSQPRKEVETSNLWTDYYNCKKPHCWNCIKQGIKDNEYKFCSLTKKPTPIYNEWGTKIIHTFNDIYACNVYHWTIYQGASNKIQNPKAKITNLDNYNQIRTSSLP